VLNRLIIAVSMTLALVCPAAAQVQGGDLTGVVFDERGGALRGVSVSVGAGDATLTAQTNADGSFRFLNLAPGSYKLELVLDGFTSIVQERIAVMVGRSFDLTFHMRLAPVKETVTVTASPLIDGRATATATNFTSAELTSIPTSRDPFSLIRAVPGALVERVNVGGNETGQQLLATAKGSRQQDTSWTIDGVEITDMAAAGQSATYFNFDNFEEVRVSTSGNDIRDRTGGLTVDLIVKRGGNQYHGGVRGYYASDSLQASNVPEELANLATPVTDERSDHLIHSSDYGFDFGGPLLKDRAWFYGSYSWQDVRLFRRSTGAVDSTTLRNPFVKANWQATPRDLVNVLYYNGYKIKHNRPPGVVAIERPEATFHQDNFYSDFPVHGLVKIGDDRVIGSHMFLSAKYAYFNTGVGLTPEGGMDAQAGRNIVTQTAYGSFQRQISARPQHTATADLHSFVSRWGASHDVKYGGGFRKVDAFTENQWPGNGILAITQTPTDLRAMVYREGNGGNRAKYFDLYAGDMISSGRFTIDFGVRYDRQWGAALPSSSAANPAYPALVPGITFAGYEAPFTWNTWSPRAGVNYAIDQERKTIARVSFSRFAGQLSTGTIGFANTAANLGGILYRWADLDGDGYAQAAEVNTAIQLATSNINAANPTSAVSPNRIDPNLEAPRTSSVIAGLDRQLTPTLSADVTYSYSRTSNLFGNAAGNITPRVGLTVADYTPGAILTGTLPNGSPYNVQTYVADPVKFAASGGGFVLATAAGYYTDYHGVEFGMNKRLSNRWMSRVSFALNNAREHFADPAGRYDTNGNPTPTGAEPLVEGGQFAPQLNGGSGNYYLNAKWQLNANAMYEAPYGINVAANVFGRQGYPFPIVRSASIGAAPNTETLSVLTTPSVDAFRYDSVWDADLRLSHEFKLPRAKVRLMGDVFNLLNANTALVRVNNVTSTTFNVITQNMTPRVLRLGLVVGF
jgi:hypothetical protein